MVMIHKKQDVQINVTILLYIQQPALRQVPALEMAFFLILRIHIILRELMSLQIQALLTGIQLHLIMMEQK